MQQDAESKLQQARTQIITRSHFFAAMLIRQVRVPNPRVPRFMVNGEELHYNPQFVEESDEEQLWFDLLVASAHTFLRHFFRARRLKESMGELDKKLFNQAAGISAVNTLHECGYTLIDGYTYDERYTHADKDGKLHTWATEKIYKRLLDDQQQEQEKEQEQKGDPEDQPCDGGAGGGDGDDQKDEDQKDDDTSDDEQDSQDFTHEDFPCHVAEIPLGEGEDMDAKESKAERSVMQAAASAKAMGNELPAAIKKEIKDIKDPKIPPQEILQRFLHERVHEGNDWSRPNKRYGDDIYMPRKSSEGIGNDLIVAFDTSYSVSEAEIQEMINEVFGFLHEIEGAGADPKITAIYCSSRIMGVEELSSDDKPNIPIGGGTSFAPVWDYVIEHDLKPKGILYFTDGECYGENSVIGEHGWDVIEETPILWMLTQPNDYFKEHAENELKFGEVLQL